MDYNDSISKYKKYEPTRGSTSMTDSSEDSDASTTPSRNPTSIEQEPSLAPAVSTQSFSDAPQDADTIKWWHKMTIDEWNKWWEKVQLEAQPFVFNDDPTNSQWELDRRIYFSLHHDLGVTKLRNLYKSVSLNNTHLINKSISFDDFLNKLRMTDYYETIKSDWKYLWATKLQEFLAQAEQQAELAKKQQQETEAANLAEKKNELRLAALTNLEKQSFFRNELWPAALTNMEKKVTKNFSILNKQDYTQINYNDKLHKIIMKYKTLLFQKVMETPFTGTQGFETGEWEAWKANSMKSFNSHYGDIGLKDSYSEWEALLDALIENWLKKTEEKRMQVTIEVQKQKKQEQFMKQEALKKEEEFMKQEALKKEEELRKQKKKEVWENKINKIEIPKKYFLSTIRRHDSTNKEHQGLETVTDIDDELIDKVTKEQETNLKQIAAEIYEKINNDNSLKILREKAEKLFDYQKEEQSEDYYDAEEKWQNKFNDYFKDIYEWKMWTIAQNKSKTLPDDPALLRIEAVSRETFEFIKETFYQDQAIIEYMKFLTYKLDRLST